MHEVESGVFARQTPWHRIGVVTPDVLTAADAIKLGGLDWTVDKEPVFRRQVDVNTDGVGEKFIEVPNRFALVRSTDQQVMSIVSDVYKPFQNHEAFSFMDTLVDSGKAKYETAMSLRGGRVVALTMHVPTDMQIAGEDKHEAYLLLRTTHDGSGRISIYIVIIRVVCMNTLTWAIQGATHSWGVTHTANVAGKIQEARESLDLTFKYTDAFKERAETLVDVKVTDDDIVKLLESVIPDRPKRDDEIEAIMDNYRGSENVQNFKGTGWGFLNAFSEYEEHGRTSRSGEAAFGRLIDGRDAKLRTSIANRLLARA